MYIYIYMYASNLVCRATATLIQQDPPNNTTATQPQWPLDGGFSTPRAPKVRMPIR